MKKLTLIAAIILATSAFAQVPNYVPTNGLVGWWPFNGNANDESGNNNNGTVNGATLTSDRNGIANKAYSFDGNNDNVIINNMTLPQGNTARSITFWAKYNALNSQQVQQHMVGYGPISNNQRFALLYWPNYFNHISIVGQGNDFAETEYIMNNDWHHFAIIYNSTNAFIYIDNVLMEQDIKNYSTLGNQLFIGFNGNNNHWSGEYYNGKLDDIAIWNRSLTDCEIKNLYNAGFPSYSQIQTALDTYTWPVNNQTYTQSGTYSDTLVNAAGCDSIVTLNLTLSFTGINDINTSKLSISPNPTAGDFTITGLELYNISTIRITDVNGKLVKELDPTASKFTLGTVKPGVYFVTITAGNKQEVIKLIKE
jgi:hypothetical protein